MSFVLNWVSSYAREYKKRGYAKNTIILHQMQRGRKAPSPSPFCLKLETWLRMAKLPYENDLGFITSLEGKVPWISHVSEDGEVTDIPDSQFAIEYLSKKYNIDLNKNLTERAKGFARSVIKMLDESFIWVLKLHRFVYQLDYDLSGMPTVVGYYAGYKFKSAANSQGYGCHTKEQIYQIGKDDLKAIDGIIGDNKFLMGSEPCDADASVFGFTCQIYYHSTGELREYLINNCPSIMRHIDTMIYEYWKDWDENTIDGAKK